MRTPKHRVYAKPNSNKAFNGVSEENVDYNQTAGYRVRRKGQPTVFVRFLVFHWIF